MSEYRHAAAEAHLRAADPIVGRIIEARRPCTLAPDPDYFARLVRAILGQQISVKAAASIRARLAALMPDGVVTPEGILRLSDDDLRAAGVSRPKARSLRDLAERVASGSLDLAGLDAKPDEEVIGDLVQVRGIGRWTAEMLLIFAMGRPDVLPVDDLGFRNAVQRAYGLSALPGPAELRRTAEPWHPYASIATWYLWRSLDNVPQQSAEPI